VTIFEEFQKHYHHQDLAAREWKEKGGRVVGYFCDSVPEELILAAGFFPLRISGDPMNGMELARQQDFPNDMEIEGFVLSMLNRILTGQYDFVDYLVIPHTRDTISKLYQVLASVKESNSTLKLPELYFFDVLRTTFYTSQLYNRDSVIEFKEKLEEWSGKEISTEQLAQAIAITNENRMLLKKVAELRAGTPPRLSGVEALQIIGSSMFMLKNEHNTLLRKYLNDVEKLPFRDGVRLFFGGSPQDNLQLYQILESFNATVVGEDNCWGNRYSDVPVETTIKNPLDAIVDRYNRKSPCPLTFPLRRRVEYCVNSAQDVNAQGAIFYSQEYDPQAWDIPDEIKALKAKGIPALYLKKQPYVISDIEQLKARIEEFLRNL
jgi:benzoyl-CoA reductase/2-hydroxyglutaryl-CoA dehydratase subunit BcrC/BadD/HgdB